MNFEMHRAQTVTRRIPDGVFVPTKGMFVSPHGDKLYLALEDIDRDVSGETSEHFASGSLSSPRLDFVARGRIKQQHIIQPH